MTIVSDPATIGLAAIVVWLAYRQFSTKKARQLPPGPRKLPLIGSLLSLPTSLEWETYARWSKEYNSDILHVDALGTSIVIANTYEAAEELLDKRSGIYSSRPHMTMFHEISGWGYQLAMLPYGDRWRASRRMFTQYFAPSNYAASRAREAFYVRRFLHQLLGHPEDFMGHIRHIVGGIAVSMAYGIETKAHNDPYITMVEEAVETVHELMIPGAFYVDAFPFLKYLPEWTPGAYFHKKGRIMRDWSVKVREETFKAAKRLIDAGLSEPSFVSENLKKLEEPGVNEEEHRQLIVDVANMVYMAAADTTASALSTFFLAMTCYPEVQKKARAEVDKVVQDRLPTHEDLPHLPYLAAVIKETLRWATVVPIGLPHLVISDDIYKGYFIPGNSIVIANLWAMSNDENEYPRPREFIPERYICNGKVDPTVRDPADIAFGFGRRACPGRHLALSTLTLAAASVLSNFDLTKKQDANGVEIEPKRDYNNMALNKPLPFPCTIKPRSKAAESLICASVAEDQ